MHWPASPSAPPFTKSAAAYHCVRTLPRHLHLPTTQLLTPLHITWPPCTSLQAFIQFTTAEAAAKARTTMHGRMFAGNMVTVLFMSEEAFQAAKV